MCDESKKNKRKRVEHDHGEEVGNVRNDVKATAKDQRACLAKRQNTPDGKESAAAAAAPGTTATTETSPAAVNIAHVTRRHTQIIACVQQRRQLLASVRRGKKEAKKTYDDQRKKICTHVLALVRRVEGKKALETQRNYSPASNDNNPMVRISLPVSSSCRPDEMTD